MHAADIADIIEELDNNSRRTLFESLDEDVAADVLEEMESKVQRSLLETLSDERATDILESMPADEAADVLGHIDESRAEKLLVQMESESSEEIRELMEYEEDTIGSIMSKEYVTFLPDTSISDVFSNLRESKPEEPETHYIFITNSANRLLGYVHLMDLIVSDNAEKLYDLMYPNICILEDGDDVDTALELMQKYNLTYAPVINDKKELVGVVSLNDLVHELFGLRRAV
jgi:Mg/Co/Ni transporter MgtE